ncbi:hypothetical protein Q2T76_03165 [Lactobacillus sp. YT155]|uniref:hypothetical protein n=1 Tax=Lactobacillus sp. YT155 TaxID=3060955 RepID=UPI00265EEDE1|nr:hypothetical protein [Lactobacillus sp. YT155]MDO1605052.1 hypothetical protein [Lactobacillus sp. YT155]
MTKELPSKMALFKRVKPAFTLLETTLALFVLTIVLAIPIASFSQFNSELTKTTFLKRCKVDWYSALLQARISQKPIYVKFLSYEQRIEFSSSVYHESLQVPSRLHLETKEGVTISRTGTVKPFTIAFTDVQTHKKISYKIQFNWGEVIEK